jgi:hypothetical protein
VKGPLGVIHVIDKALIPSAEQVPSIWHLKLLVLLPVTEHRDATDDLNVANGAPRLLNRVALLKSEVQTARSSSG